MRFDPGAVRRALTGALAAITLMAGQAAFAALPSGFTETTLTRPDGAAWQEAVGLAFAPNGRLFVWERGGSVWVIDATSPLTTRFIDIRNEVAAYRDHGLLGFALHPNFVANGFVYLLYAVEREHLVNCDSPRTGPPVCGPGYTPGAHTPFQPTLGRVTRYRATRPVGDSDYSRANGIDPTSRVVLLGESYWVSDPTGSDPTRPRNTGCPLMHESHGVGSLVFGQDGTLMVSCGDGAHYSGVDQGPGSGAYDDQARSEGLIRPAEAVGAFRSQLVDSFGGKLLRLDPDTGDGVASNPFYDPATPRAARSRVWALGLRNPFRFSLRPDTGVHDPLVGNPGVFYVGDVGWTEWEDLDVVQAGGQNFGWPLYEGQEQQNDYWNTPVSNQDAPNPLYDGAGCTRQYFLFRELTRQDTLATPSWPNPCNSSQQITSAEVFVHERPAIDWRHGASSSRFAAFNGNNAVAWPIGSTAPDGRIVVGAPFPGSSSTGGIWYTGGDFPAPYTNTYFQGDYGAQWIKSFVFDQNNVLTEVRNFGDGLGGVVALASHPLTGGLYYISWTAFVKKISYAPTTNVPPVAVATVDRRYGPSPLVVNFDASQTTDANGGALAYTWNFGDGSPTQTGITASHTYTAAGITNFTATLTVRDSGGLTGTTTVLISVNNTPPGVTITSPLDNSTYSMTEPTQLPLTASLDDAESGPAALSCSWTTILHHNQHTHNDPPTESCSTITQITPIGCESEIYFYELRLVVTDPQGLATTVSSNIYPDCPAQDTTPPTAPGNLDGVTVSYSQADLNWLPAADNVGVTGYLIERCTGVGCSNFAQVGASAGTTFTSAGLSGGTSYSWRVRATDAAGNVGGYSNTLTLVMPAAPPALIRVNVGGPAYTDAEGNAWSADTGYNTGSALAWPAETAIAGTSDPTLYRTERWDAPAAPALTYSFTVPNGVYQVRLHFAENYSALFAVGQRVFDVQAEGATAIAGLDVFAEAGAQTALVKTISVTVADGVLNLVFVHGVEDPFVNAIEVLGSDTGPDTTPPTVPVLAAPVPVGANRIDLTWSAAFDAVGVTGYHVERCQEAGCADFAEIAQVSGSITALGNTGLAATTSYSYRVRARDAAGNLSAYSNVGTATTGTVPDTTPPTAPVLAAPTVAGSTQIDLAWSASSDAVGVTGYFVERCQGAGCTTFSEIAQVSAAVTTLSNTGLAPGTSYSYRVRATDAAGNLSAWSNVGSATTAANPDTTPPTAPVLAAPVAVSATQVNLTWSASSDAVGVTGYRIERCSGIGCSNFTQIGTTAATSFSVTSLAPATSYSFRVRATDAAGNLSAWSNVASVTTPAPPALAIRVNVGGPSLTDSAGNTWLADTGYNTGNALSWPAGTAIAGTSDPALYRTERWDAPSAPALTYSFTVPNGGYQVRLHFAENYPPLFAIGQRVFAVQVEGVTVNPALDVFAEAGARTALVKTYNTTVADGAVTIAFVHGVEDPFVNAIEVISQAPGDTTPPTAPVLGIPVAASATQIDLAWSAATDAVGVTGYQVESCSGAGCTTFAQVGTSATLAFSHGGLAPLTSHSYRVRATDAAGNLGPWSNTGTAVTLADTTPPTAPVLATPVAAGPTQVNLSWSAASDAVGVTGYRVERCSGSGCTTFLEIASLPAGTTTLANTGLTPATSYSYRVRAADAAGNLGPFSNTGSVTTATAGDTTPPTAPVLAAPTVVSSSRIDLAWSAAFDAVGVTGYRIERCTGAGCSSFTQVGTTTTTGYSSTSLSPSTSYSFRVRATDAAGNLGAWSNVVSATTQPPPAVAIRVNVGGPAYTDVAGNAWSADTGFNTGNALAWPAGTAIAGTTDPALYRTERWDSPGVPAMTYSFAVPNGSYQVRLHFAENYPPLFAVGQRVFDVQAEGVTAVTGLDVFAEAGARTALVKTFNVTVADGTLNLVFVHGIEDPFVNAIEVTSQ